MVEKVNRLLTNDKNSHTAWSTMLFSADVPFCNKQPFNRRLDRLGEKRFTQYDNKTTTTQLQKQTNKADLQQKNSFGKSAETTTG